MVSASHNPYYDNGIKVLDSTGHKIAANIEEEMEKYIDGLTSELPFGTGDGVGIATDYAIGRNRYIGHLISLATRSYSGKRIGLDCANGSAHQIAKSVFDALGAKTYVIGNEPNGLNINEQVGSTHIETLQARKDREPQECFVSGAQFVYEGDER